MPGITIVDASAGSGKTYELAKQYIRLLISGESPAPGEILAITFTNKASFEMKERVLVLLKKAALGLFDDPAEFDRIISGALPDRETARKKSGAALDEIFKNYSSLRIQTIDSLLHSILETSPLELNLPARFTVKDNSDEDVAYTLEKLINSSGENRRVKKAFLHFIDCFLNVENKPGWFPKRNMLEIVLFLLSLLNSYGKNISGSRTENIRARKKELFEIILRLREKLPEGTKKAVLAVFSRIDSVDDVRASLMAGKTTAQERLPVKKGFESSPEADRLWRKFRELLRKLCEAEARAAFNPYVDIFSMVLESFPEVRKDRGAVFLQEINRLSAPVFENNLMDAGELLLRLASKFRHYMLDEFQDTSLLQLANLSPLMEEALASGGSLFCVGDKKQAIYRFRGGDFTLAGRIAERYGAYGVNLRRLSHNYRSQREVVQFNNRVFSSDNLRQFLAGLGEQSLSDSDREDILGVFSNAEQSWEPQNDSGRVSAEFTDAETEEEKDDLTRQKLIPLVQDASGRLGASNTAVLARSNSEAQKFSGWLISSGIPVFSERTLDIRAHNLVREILSLLKFLHFPPDDISFTAFIQGGIFSKVSGISNETRREFICRRSREPEGSPLYAHFRKQFPGDWGSFIEEFMRTAGTVPVYESIREIIRKFSVCLEFPGAHAFIMKLLETVKNFEEENDDACMRSFLKHIESAPEEEFHLDNFESSAVRVMTIHKAKGLEFEAVIVPFFDISVKPGRSGAIIDGGCDDIKLLRIPPKFTLASPLLARAYAEEYKRSVIDELNIAYVALTRAKRELYLFLPGKDGGARNRARLLIPGNVAAGAKTRASPPGGAAPAETLSPDASLTPPALFGGQSGFGKPAARREIILGRAVHRILARFNSSCEPGQGALASEAKSDGLRPGERAAALDTISALFKIQGFRKICMPGPGETVFTEKEIVGESGRAMRIDRLIAGGKSARVIDFKTSVPSAADAGQVGEYVRAVKRIFPEKRVEGFLVYTASGKTVKIDG